jgi:hypothetical protein
MTKGAIAPPHDLFLHLSRQLFTALNLIDIGKKKLKCARSRNAAIEN